MRAYRVHVDTEQRDGHKGPFAPETQDSVAQLKCSVVLFCVVLMKVDI